MLAFGDESVWLNHSTVLEIGGEGVWLNHSTVLGTFTGGTPVPREQPQFLIRPEPTTDPCYSGVFLSVQRDRKA